MEHHGHSWYQESFSMNILCKHDDLTNWATHEHLCWLSSNPYLLFPFFTDDWNYQQHFPRCCPSPYLHLAWRHPIALACSTFLRQLWQVLTLLIWVRVRRVLKNSLSSVSSGQRRFCWRGQASVGHFEHVFGGSWVLLLARPPFGPADCASAPCCSSFRLPSVLGIQWYAEAV